MSIILYNGRLSWWKRFFFSIKNLFFWRDSYGQKYAPLSRRFWICSLLVLGFIAISTFLWIHVMTSQYESGRQAGYSTGYSAGYTAARQSSYKEGWSYGYQKGMTDGLASGRTEILSRLESLRIATGTNGSLLLELLGSPSSIEEKGAYFFWQYDDVIFKMGRNFRNGIPDVVPFQGDFEKLRQRQLRKAKASR